MLKACSRNAHFVLQCNYEGYRISSVPSHNDVRTSCTISGYTAYKHPAKVSTQPISQTYLYIINWVLDHKSPTCDWFIFSGHYVGMLTFDLGIKLSFTMRSGFTWNIGPFSRHLNPIHFNSAVYSDILVTEVIKIRIQICLLSLPELNLRHR